MKSHEIIRHCGGDAAKWAAEKQGWAIPGIDEGLMIGWFANAIETSKDLALTAAQARIAELEGALRSITDDASDTYRARNNRRVSLEDDNGEKCWIVSDDALVNARATLAGEGG